MFLNRFKFLPYVMWLLPVTFFAYQFILRLWPGLMMHQIMEQFSIDARHFGVMAAIYYYGYSGMQIPVAILLDRWGARNVVFGFASLCGIATLIFTFTDNFYLACAGRFLVGAGSAVGFLSVSKVISQWFPQNQYARMVGFSFTLGLMGAIYGGKPVSFLVESYSWQGVAITLGVVSILLGTLTYLILRTPTNEARAPESGEYKMENFKVLLSSPLIWLLALANLLMVGSLEGFADVWGVSYLIEVYGLSKGDAAGLISYIFYGMLFGGPVLAFCSKQLGNYPVIALSGLGMALAFVCMLFQGEFHWGWMSTLLFVIGVLCCYQVIVFAAGSDLVDTKYLGVTIAFLNCVNMLGGSFFHTSIGAFMDLFWEGSFTAEGLRQYGLHTYRMALMIIPVCSLVGAGLSLSIGVFIKRRRVQLAAASL